MPLRWLAGCILVVFCGASGCGKSPQPEDYPDNAVAVYVGSERCGDCHDAELQAWLGSHHQRAMLPANDLSVIADFGDTSYSRGGARTSFSRSGGRFTVHADGTEGVTEAFDVRYTFGVEPLQQYLLELPGGRLQALAVAWDTGARRWLHLQPEDGIHHTDPLHWTRPEYNWNTMCADCHSTGVRKGYDPRTKAYATEFAEVSVGCEACHGPGSEHVAWAAAPAGEDGAEERWAKLPAGRGIMGLESQMEQLNSCAPCHSRRTQLAEGFTPDQPLLDYYLPALLEPGLYEADGQILDEVYVYGSFLQSRMHDRGVACTDCHQAHAAGLVAQGNQLCTRCHNQAGHPDFPTLPLGAYDTPDHHLHAADSAGSRCVSCHMPERTYMLVDDRHDHGFRIPRPDLTVTAGVPNACNGCHDDRTGEWARAVLAQHFGAPQDAHFATVIAAARRGQPAAAAQLAALGGDAGQAAIVRATALALMGNYDDAATALALERGLRDSSALVRIGALRGAARFNPETSWRRANHLLDDGYLAVRTEAARLLAGALAGLPESERAGLQQGLDEYLATQQFNADWPQAQSNMAAAYLATGDLKSAEAALETALELADDWVPALVNLADLYRATGRDGAGAELLDRASALAPGSAQVKLARALWLIRQDRDSEALPLLAAAVESAPDDSYYAYVYAIALHSRGDSTQALTVLDEALRRRPGDRQLLSAGASIAREMRNDPKAGQHGEQL